MIIIQYINEFNRFQPQISTVSHLVSIAASQAEQIDNNDENLQQILTAPKILEKTAIGTATSDATLQTHSTIPQTPTILTFTNPQNKIIKRKETIEAKRERKAAKTLAIITGAFVICWLPFFVMAILLPLCTECEAFFTDTIASVFLWLGYFNSTLNPVIYTIFSPEFRQAFKRILCGQHHPRHFRSGKI